MTVRFPEAASAWRKFGGLANGTYTIKPVQAGWRFIPESRTITVHNNDLRNVDFAHERLGASGIGAILLLLLNEED